ncbi:NAD(P)H-binding protein, partial [Winogradskyella sp.]|uniref:NAD(P)H-binding protein n=1 Tax=Winogradskyella sp. TaxID=1883156 RepID=UPI00261346F9
MKVLVVGASGATGRYLVNQLLIQGNEVKVIVRTTQNLPGFWKDNAMVQIITASILELSDEEISKYVSDCHSVASCLGHNLNWKGIYGKPRKLVTDA